MLQRRQAALATADGDVPATGGDADGADRRARALARTFATRYAIVGVLIVLTIATNVLYPGFFEIGNLRNILTQNAPVGIVAIGMTFVIVAGGFDLSVSAIFATCGVAFATFSGTMPLAVAFAAALGVGLVAGAVNGAIVTRLRVNPFVATLGTASVFSGLAYLWSHSAPVIPENPAFSMIDDAALLGIPVSIVIFAGAFAIGGVALSKTVFGRSVYAVGGNAEAARLAGMRVDLIRFATYMITGFCAALAGALVASRTGVGQADIGAAITLDAIAIVIIGGTSLLGGEGAMWRTLVGLLILATINNLFDSLALDTAAQSLVKGLIVIGAVALDSHTRRSA